MALKPEDVHQGPKWMAMVNEAEGTIDRILSDVFDDPPYLFSIDGKYTKGHLEKLKAIYESVGWKFESRFVPSADHPCSSSCWEIRMS